MSSLVSQDHILVVEDDPEMAVVLRQGLEQDNLSVSVAQDGREGLHNARHCKFQAIVLDVMLPVLDGFAVARELRAEGNRIPILMLTARDGVPDIVRGLDSGVDDYLTKPFSFLELSARLRALLRRTAAPVTRLAVADLVMDLSSLQVWRESRSLRLSRTEFQLLEVLMRHQGHIVRRRDLLREVWGANTIVEENTLDVCMSSLRARIELPGLPRLIHTVRGFGYRMEAPE